MLGAVFTSPNSLVGIGVLPLLIHTGNYLSKMVGLTPDWCWVSVCTRSGLFCALFSSCSFKRIKARGIWQGSLSVLVPPVLFQTNRLSFTAEWKLEASTRLISDLPKPCHYSASSEEGSLVKVAQEQVKAVRIEGTMTQRQQLLHGQRRAALRLCGGLALRRARREKAPGWGWGQMEGIMY